MSNPKFLKSCSFFFSRNDDTCYRIHDWIKGNSALKVMMVKTSGPSSKDRVGHTIVWFFSIEKELFFRSENQCLMMTFYLDMFHRFIEFTITKLKEFIQRISKIFS